MPNISLILCCWLIFYFNNKKNHNVIKLKYLNYLNRLTIYSTFFWSSAIINFSVFYLWPWETKRLDILAVVPLIDSCEIRIYGILVNPLKPYGNDYQCEIDHESKQGWGGSKKYKIFNAWDKNQFIIYLILIYRGGGAELW